MGASLATQEAPPCGASSRTFQVHSLIRMKLSFGARDQCCCVAGQAYGGCAMTASPISTLHPMVPFKTGSSRMIDHRYVDHLDD